MSTSVSAESFCEIVLSKFISNNPHCKVSLEKGETVLIDKPWGREDIRLKAQIDEQDFIHDLNQMRFDARFDAIFHLDNRRMEIAFGYLSPDDPVDGPIINRKFYFHFEGNEFLCEFLEPTDRFLRLANHYERIPGEDGELTMRQLMMFRDAQKIDKLPERQQEYFKGKVARNFFISAQCDFNNLNIEKLARHINFLLHYYDRHSPTIVVRQVSEKSVRNVPIRMIEDAFPEACQLTEELDDIVLRLLEVASTSSARFAFIYYYQVFEYLGYYYMDNKARSALRNAFRDPSIICGGEAKLDDLFSIFSELNQNDEAKMRKAIEEHCDSRIIWKEISNDLDFFSTDQNFDGGFVAPALIAKSVTSDTWDTMWMPKTFDLLTKVRNVLVHAREKRESKVILPSNRNNAILQRYIPLIRRIAEQLALKAY